MNNIKLKFNIFQSIRSKLVLLYMALVFIVMTISGTYIYMEVRNEEAESIKEDLGKYVDYADQLLLKGNTDTSDSEQRLMDEIEAEMKKPSTDSPIYGFGLSGRTDVEFCILDPKGFVKAPKDIRSSHFDDSVIISALSGNEKYSSWEKDYGKSRGKRDFLTMWIKYAVPHYDDNGDIKYIIYVGKDVKDELESINKIVDTLLIAVVIAMTLAIIIGVLFSATITGPISSLTKTAGEMARGNLAQRIPVKSDDEIGQLTDSFNHMAESLYTTMTDMSIEKSRMEIVLNNMTDGVLAYDLQNQLVHANYASLEMLGIKDIENTSFQSIMTILGIKIEDVQGFLKEKPKDNTAHINDKYISLNHSPYISQEGNAEGIVIVLQDVTKHTKLDNMRKEFVANVSHEIRTPLTTIKTYSETLLDGALEDRETAVSFLNTINSEADRITLLTSDLLELSHFDNKQMKMEMEEVNLISLIYNSIRQNTVLAGKKNQRIIFEPEINQMFIECDPARINQVLNNIISNAIKYSPENTNVTITLNTGGRFYKVFISDQGMGIPKEDLNRIFERFYRVDKARSRSMGGTGLGLSIAKEIMEANGGNITALSTQGEGTTMVLTFNKLKQRG